MSTAPELVVLRGGEVVPFDALRLLWELEDRAFSIRRDGDELVIRPGSRLSFAERAAVRRHRDALLMLVNYVERVQ